MSQGSTPTSRRPAKPRPSPWVPASVVAFVAITWWAGSDAYGIGFSVPEILENFERSSRIVSDFFDPRWGIFDNSRVLERFLETVQMAVVGAVLGCVTALVVAFLASRVTTPGSVPYLLAKGFLNLVRSIPDVMYALLFVAVVAGGPIAGVLALFFFNIGVVAKLLSETVDGVDVGPLEAAEAAGVGKTKAVRSSVFPQVLPNYLAYSLYTFELNLRASTVLGIVGAGGIGLIVNEFRAAFRYGELSVIIVQIFIIVFVVESISIALRRRLV